MSPLSPPLSHTTPKTVSLSKLESGSSEYSFQLNLNLGTSVPVFAMPNVSKILPSSFSQDAWPSISDHLWYLIGFFYLYHLPSGIESPRSAFSKKTLLGWFSQNLPLPLMFSLSNFPPTDSYLLLGYKSPFLVAELSTTSLPSWETPIVADSWIQPYHFLTSGINNFFFNTSFLPNSKNNRRSFADMLETWWGW